MFNNTDQTMADHTCMVAPPASSWLKEHQHQRKLDKLAQKSDLIILGSMTIFVIGAVVAVVATGLSLNTRMLIMLFSGLSFLLTTVTLFGLMARRLLQSYQALALGFVIVCAVAYVAHEALYRLLF